MKHKKDKLSVHEQHRDIRARDTSPDILRVYDPHSPDDSRMDQIPVRTSTGLSTRARRNRQWVSSAGYRWLRSNVGRPWNEVYPEFRAAVGGDVRDLKSVVRHTKLIDGELHVIGHSLLYPISTHYSGRMGLYYVDTKGILRHIARTKTVYKPRPAYLMKVGNEVWFRTAKGIFHAPVDKATSDWLKSWRRFQVGISYGTLVISHAGIAGIPDGVGIAPRFIRQAKTRKAPPGVVDLAPVPDMSKSLCF